jgi:peptidoglycan/LPS O-acetylase OafA/YrhL
MRASSLSFQAAVAFVIAGMVWGLQMAISNDHAAFPAHAHLNLLGWVSLFLFGIYYYLHPALDRSRAALIQVVAWIVGTAIMAVGVGLVHTGHEVGDPVAAVGSIIVLVAMLLFGWLLVRCEHRSTGEQNVIISPSDGDERERRHRPADISHDPLQA